MTMPPLLLAGWIEWEVTAYSHSCTMPKGGKEYSQPQLTASGKPAIPNLTVAAGPHLPFGTRILLSHDGILSPRIVQDRGRAIVGHRLDLFVTDCASARLWGRRRVWGRVEALPKPQKRK